MKRVINLLLPLCGVGLALAAHQTASAMPMPQSGSSRLIKRFIRVSSPSR